MSEFRLNMLPLEVEATSDGETVHRLERDSGADSKVRSLAETDRGFVVYSYARHTYVWPRLGRALPSAVEAVEADQVIMDTLPAAVLAVAARESAADHLICNNFERLPSSLARPIRLFRRQRNLAQEALQQEFGEGVGIFPVVAVQAIPLAENLGQPGPVGIVLDVRLLDRLDIPLAELAEAGIDLSGMPVVWRHQEGCRCGPEQLEGSAGRIVGGDPRGIVEVARGGTTREFPAACLGPRASRTALERYFADLRGASPRQIHGRLDAVTSKFQQPRRQWQYLEYLRSILSPFTLFRFTKARLASPTVASSEPSGTLATPNVLAPLTAPDLNFRYAAPQVAQGAAVGLREHGPYDRETTTRRDTIRARIICPRGFQAEGRRLLDALRRPVGGFPGIQERYQLRSFTADLCLFEGQSAVAYRTAAAEAGREQPDIVFLVVKYEDRYANPGQNPYLAAKALLAGVQIASQAVTVETLRQRDPNLRWSIDSIALQTYAKVGNVPFVLHDPSGVRELVIGVGRSDLHDPQQGYCGQLFGAAAAFRQDGDFLYAGSTAPVGDRDTYEDVLTELLTGFLARYESGHGTPPERLVIHVFKKTGRKELAAVQRALGSRPTKFALLHVNRDTPLWIAEATEGRIATAAPGTVVGLGEHDRLLMAGDATTRRRQSMHPLRLELDRASTFCDMDRLTWQVHGFTATSWRGFHRANEPSTILYGRLLAEKVGQLHPYGFQRDAAAVIGDRPWFL